MAHPRPTPAQLAWQRFEVGLLYHFDLTTWREDGSDHSGSGPPPDAGLFKPDQLDTDQWLAAAVAAGARYAILTASHETGFMLWQSDLYPYGVGHVPWRDGKGDVVADFIASCHRVGVQPALFIGLRFNSWFGVRHYRVDGDDPTRQAEYLRVCEQQVEELCSRYGPLAEIWIEGGALAPEEGGPDILPIVERHQPDTCFYHSPHRGDHRWVGNEKGVAGDPCWATMPHRGGRTAHGTASYSELLPHGDPDGAYWSPAMCDVPIRDHRWFWHPDEDHLLYDVDDLMDMYERSVGRNGVLTIGAVPDRRGLIPEADMARYTELGREVQRRYGRPLASTAGEGDTVELPLPAPAVVDRVEVKERIEDGERVRGWRLEGHTPDGWQTLSEGESIGHRRLAPVGPVEVRAVRFVCTASTAAVRIGRLAAYDTGGG